MTDTSKERYRPQRTLPQEQLRQHDDDAHSLKRLHKRRRAIGISYLLVFFQILFVFLTVLSVCVSMIVNHSQALEDAFCTPDSVQIQRGALDEKMESLAEKYAFSADDMKALLSEKQIIAFNRKAANYWIELFHGSEADAPHCLLDVEAALLEDAGFVEAHGEASAQAAQKAAGEVLSEVESSAYPISGFVAQMGLKLAASYRAGDIVRCAAMGGAVLFLLCGVGVYFVNHARMIRIGWYEGSALVCGGALALIARFAIVKLPFVANGTNARLLGMLTSLLQRCDLICLLVSALVMAVGGILMIAYAVWVYRCNHYTHNELFGRY